jgi:hypothetical protein
MSENNKTICTDVAVKHCKCQYHYDRAAKQHKRPKKSSSVAGPGPSLTSSNNIGPRGLLNPPQQTSPSINNIGSRGLLDPPSQASTNNISPHTGVGTLLQPSASTISSRPLHRLQLVLLHRHRFRRLLHRFQPNLPLQLIHPPRPRQPCPSHLGQPPHQIQ